MGRYHSKYGYIREPLTKSDKAFVALRLIFFIVIVAYIFWFTTRPLPKDMEKQALSDLTIALLVKGGAR